MAYERDTDAHLKGVGTIAARAGAMPRADRRRRMRQAQALRQRDRALSGMTYGPRGGVMQALGMVKIPTFGRTGTKEAPVVTSGGVVEGGGTIGGGGTINTGGLFTSGGGGGGVSPTNTVGGKLGNALSSAINAIQGTIGPRTPPASVGICVDANGNKIACPPLPGNTGIVPPQYQPPPPPPSPSPTTSGGGYTGGGGGGGGGSGVSTDPVPLPPIDTTGTSLDPIPDTMGMSTNTKILLGVGAAAALYLLFKKKG